MKERYREILREELERRCQRNPRYSLRAFARELMIEPTQLSRVLNGKQNISPASARYVAEKLFRSENQRNYFIHLVEYSTARKKGARDLALRMIERSRPQQESQVLELEVLRVIGDWYHIALLDLTLLDDFSPDPRSISKRLGISVVEASSAISRLKKLGLLAEEQGRLKKTSVKLATPSDIPSAALRKAHRQFITKAIESLEEQDLQRRSITGKTMAIDRRRIPEIKALIEECSNKISALIHAPINGVLRRDSLYQLNFQLYDLERNKT